MKDDNTRDHILLSPPKTEPTRRHDLYEQALAKKEEPKLIKSEFPFMGIVIGGASLRYRSEPNGDILGFLNSNDEVKVIGKVKDKSKGETWYQISIESVPYCAYVKSEFIKRNER